MAVTWQLKGATVKRCGVTARYLNHETRDVRCEADGATVKFRFEMSSKGGGTTAVQLEVGPRDFTTMVEAMCAVSRSTAMKVIAAELAKEVAKQPEHDVALKRTVLKSVVDLAHDKYIQAPMENDDKERLIHGEVQKLINELAPNKKPDARAA